MRSTLNARGAHAVNVSYMIVPPKVWREHNSYRVGVRRKSAGAIRNRWRAAKQHRNNQGGKVFEVTRGLLGGRFGAEAANGLGLTDNADVGAHRRCVLAFTRAVHAIVGPPAAIRRALLDRDIFRRPSRRDFDFGGGGGSAGKCHYRQDSDRETKMPHAALRASSSTHPIGSDRPVRDDFSSNRHHALCFCLSMIFSENRYPLFRIMLRSTATRPW